MTVTILLKVCPTKTHRFRALFFYNENTLIHTTDFGSRTQTFIDHRDKNQKKEWLKLNRINGNWNDVYDTIALTRHLLWSQTSLRGSVKTYASKHHLKIHDETDFKRLRCS